MKSYNYLPPLKASKVRALIQKTQKEKYKYDIELKRLVHKLNTDNNLTIDRWIEKIELRIVILNNTTAQ